tara:strand:+ start:84 stop:1778 length:1695 start_codon:yes stop_codon:yes gene_type:complete
MSILSVDTIQPIGSGSTVTLNAAKIVVGTGITFESNGQAIYAGIITATSFSGSGANLTSLPAQATIANNADNRVITGGSGVNLNGEANVQIDSTGRLLLGAGAIANPKSSGAGSIDLDNQAFSIIVGGNHPSGGRSNNNAKTFRMSMVHYALAEEPINILQGYCDSSDNNVYIGGGTGSANSLTSVRIYTGANTTTTGGTERFRIHSAGQIGLSGANYGSSGQVLTSQGSSSAATWSTVSGTTINNNANNRVITGSGTANTLEGEAGLTFDGSNFNFSRQDAGDARMYIYGGEGGDARLLLGADEGDDHIDTYEFRSQASNNALVLYQFESGAYRNRMEFETGGNIGINRTNPSSLLHIETTDTTSYSISTAQTNGILTLGGNNGGGAGRCVGIQFNGTASNGEAFITLVAESTTEANLHFGMRSGGSRGDRMRISRGGDIGAPSGNNIYNASDERLKENMIELTDGLIKIKELKPISFNWKEGWNKSLDGVTQYGFGAQTTQVVDEKLVEPFGTGDVELNGETIENPLRVNEKYIIPLLVKAVQELSTEVETLKTKVAALTIS